VTKIILSKDQLRKQINRLKTKNKKIVLVHGVFDLVHPGHINYFHEAKSYGDVLIVSLTSDKYVKKGLNKPYFNEKDRLNFLGQLSLVDFVYCNDTKDASNIIKYLRPHFYIKGPDYKKKSGDEAGNLEIEKRAIKKVKGEFLTTSGVQYSSSNLINEKLGIFNNENSNWLKKIKTDANKNNYIEDFESALKKIKNQKILVIGEVIFDEYNYVDPLGKPSKENILSVNFKKRETFLGGCLPVAKNLSKICNNLTILSLYEKQSTLQKIKKTFKGNRIKLKLFKRNDYLDIYKRRYLNNKNFSKIFEVYNFKDEDFYDEKVKKYLSKNLRYFDKVIVCDFGHGLINSKISNIISSKSKFLSANIQTNSGNRGFNLFNKYKKLDFLSIDEPELRLGVKDKKSNIEKIIKSLPRKKYKRIMITRGVEGLNYLHQKKVKYIPALSTKPLDTIGAGDAAFSFASIFIGNTNNANLIALVSAIAGALKVQIVGHRNFIKIEDILRSLRSLLK